jgi:hypothetical protein
MALKALGSLAVPPRLQKSDGNIPRRAQEDTAENDDQDRCEVQRIQRESELLVHFGKERRRGQTAVTGKSINHAAARCHDRGGCEKQADQRDPSRC